MRRTKTSLTIKEKRELKRKAAALLPALIIVKGLISEIDDFIEVKYLLNFIKEGSKKLNAIHQRLDDATLDS